MKTMGKHVKLQVNRYETIDARNYWAAQTSKPPAPKLDNAGQVKELTDRFEKIAKATK